MSKRKEIVVNIEVNTPVIPSKSSADIVIAIIEHLLFQRNQIPFVCKTFKYMVSKFVFTEVGEEDWMKYWSTKYKKQAAETLNAIKTISKNIRDEYDAGHVKTTKILFGPSNHKPKEVYSIKLPKTCESHSIANHLEEVNRSIKCILIALSTSEELYDLFASNLSQTNMFLELEKTHSNRDDSDFVLKVEDCIPPSCRIVTINIVHKDPCDKMIPNCCKNMTIFGDVDESLVCNDALKNATKDENKQSFSWFESKTFVKGFTDVLVKGRSIWNE